jgi:hypothetical protein
MNSLFRRGINLPLLSPQIHNKIVVAISGPHPFMPYEENLFVQGMRKGLVSYREHTKAEPNGEILARYLCVQ